MVQRIVSVGECMIELAPHDTGLYQQGFAGDTFNSAWYLARLLPASWQVDYASAVGDDAMSDRMAEFMRESGIGTDHLWRVPGAAPGLYMIALKNGERSFSYWRGQSAARRLADDPARLAAALKGARLILFSGITLAILAPDRRAAFLTEIAAARAGGSLVAFDPNMRARLWESPEAMRAAVMAAAAVSDIVLPSFDEEQAQFGDAAPAATLARYRGAGVKTVVVKNGGDAILARIGGEEVELAPPPAPKVVDTTAAGDSFNAGFLSAHLIGAAPRDALLKGCGAAGQVIGARGALVPLV